MTQYRAVVTRTVQVKQMVIVTFFDDCDSSLEEQAVDSAINANMWQEVPDSEEGVAVHVGELKEQE